MKKIILLIFLTFTTITTFAQRFAFVDSEYIRKHMPEYTAAQKQIAALTDQLQKEVDAKSQEIERMYKAYDADKVLMTADMKKRREAEIADKEKEVKDFQRQKFGPDGDLAKKSDALIKPIDEKLMKAIEAVAESEDYDMIFDNNNSEVLMLYANPRYNKSNDVIIRLGLKPGVFAK
ncbi:MAG TPA: OmpH family outer membrane protein [Mucilaginibacter sp.]|jgi:outer membrane protein|nr:OmpH family outer membrane protein [Mucilaginibacter sp.]